MLSACSTRARKLNLKMPLNMVKYPLWVQKLLYYTIQHESGRHTDFRQISISPRQILLFYSNSTVFFFHFTEQINVDEKINDDALFEPQLQKIVIFTYPGLHFLFALGTPLRQSRKTLHE